MRRSATGRARRAIRAWPTHLREEELGVGLRGSLPARSSLARQSHRRVEVQLASGMWGRLRAVVRVHRRARPSACATGHPALPRQGVQQRSARRETSPPIRGHEPPAGGVLSGAARARGTRTVRARRQLDPRRSLAVARAQRTTGPAPLATRGGPWRRKAGAAPQRHQRRARGQGLDFHESCSRPPAADRFSSACAWREAPRPQDTLKEKSSPRRGDEAASPPMITDTSVRSPFSCRHRARGLPAGETCSRARRGGHRVRRRNCRFTRCTNIGTTTTTDRDLRGAVPPIRACPSMTPREDDRRCFGS